MGTQFRVNENPTVCTAILLLMGTKLMIVFMILLLPFAKCYSARVQRDQFASARRCTDIFYYYIIEVYTVIGFIGESAVLR